MTNTWIQIAATNITNPTSSTSISLSGYKDYVILAQIRTTQSSPVGLRFNNETTKFKYNGVLATPDGSNQQFSFFLDSSQGYISFSPSSGALSGGKTSTYLINIQNMHAAINKGVLFYGGNASTGGNRGVTVGLGAWENSHTAATSVQLISINDSYTGNITVFGVA
jgi:hypothetical protein